MRRYWGRWMVRCLCIRNHILGMKKTTRGRGRLCKECLMSHRRRRWSTKKNTRGLVVGGGRGWSWGRKLSQRRIPMRGWCWNGWYKQQRQGKWVKWKNNYIYEDFLHWTPKLYGPLLILLIFLSPLSPFLNLLQFLFVLVFFMLYWDHALPILVYYLIETLTLYCCNGIL